MTLSTVPDDMSRSETFRANIRRLGDAGKPFDICTLARQLPLAGDLARACPGTSLVLDHCGVPDIAGGAFDSWAAHIREFAGIDNIVEVKVSGISAYAAPGRATPETLARWMDAVLDAFGPGRLVWGSDWPVVNLGASLPDWIEVTTGWLARLVRDEAAQVAEGNARRIWGLARA